MQSSTLETAALNRQLNSDTSINTAASSGKSFKQQLRSSEPGRLSALPFWALAIWLAMLAAVLALAGSSGDVISFDGMPAALWSTFTA
jgi:hypothetical protein